MSPTGKKMVSRAIALILLVVGVGVGAGITYASLLAGGQFNSGLCASGRTLTIGMLTDKTDGLSSQGVRAAYAAQQAVVDINTYLSNAGCNLKFTVSISDYQLDAAIALTDLQNFASAGVQVVVGPLNSGALQNLIQYANSNHIVVISPSSTSAALAIPESSTKYYFRTAPDDRWQGMADARMIQAEGATKLIVVQRHDTYGDALANATANNFNLLVTNKAGTVNSNGCTASDTVCIIQYAPSTTDFTTTVTALFNGFAALNATTAINHVAISSVAFEEFTQMIYQINAQHPSLLKGHLPGCNSGPNAVAGCTDSSGTPLLGPTSVWTGTDGQAQDTLISSNSTSSGYFGSNRLPSTIYGFLNNTKAQALDALFPSISNGNVCDNYCRGAYDDVWLGALATVSAGAYSGTKIQAIMPTVAANYYGVTGWNGLDSNGDRVANIYQVWKVVASGSSYTWVYAGEWTADPTPNTSGTLDHFNPY
jgi:branched-chain amino acid transport system substrate-binding protein